MLAKIIFLLLFLIITFSSSGLCIRNENQIDAESVPEKGSTFFPDENVIPSVEGEARQNYRGHHQSEGSKFAFPNKQEDHFYNANEMPASSADFYARPPANIVRGSAYQAAFNTGERYRPPSNYPSSPNYPNTLFASGGNGRDVPNYPGYNDPNYLAGNYAQNYDYLPGNRPAFNGPPNYGGRPVPLAPVPFNPYQYQGASPYPAGPPGYPPISPGGTGDGPGISGLPLLFGNSLTNIFNIFRAPPTSPFAEQFTRALEDIARNDDLQCVPKLLCQMAGDPSRRKHLPDFISTPALAALIAAVPPASPKLAFGKAALLGLTGGEENCHSTYPRCPRNEDHLLYYLNNHKGGFFRFFNGGGPFADQTNQNYPSTYDHHPQGSNHNQDYDSNSPGINLGSIGSGLGLISNIASLFPSINPLSSENYQTMSNTVGNLFSNLIGNTFSSKQLSKRSIVESAEIEEKEELHPEEGRSLESSETIKELKSNSSKESEENDEIEGRIINKEIHSDYFEHHDDIVVFPYEDEREHKGKRGRKPKVVHSHNYNRDEDKFTFPSKYHDDRDDNESYRDGKKVNFEDEFNYAPQYPFPDDQDYRPYETHMIFPDRTGTGNLRFDNDKFHTTKDRDRDRDRNRDRDRDRDRDQDRYRDRDQDRYRDRDQDRYRDYDYNRDHNYNHDHYRDRYRYGKILSRPVYNRDYYRPNYDSTDRYRLHYSSSQNYDYHTTTQRPDYSQSYYANRYTTARPYYNDDYYNNRYTTRRPYTQYYYPTKRPDYDKNYYTTPRPNYNYDYYKDRYTTPKPKDPDLNVYVTNSKGVVDYYIKPNGEKVYV